MADEDKEKAEKLAAAKKRFEQLKKEQQKKGKKGGAKKKAEKSSATDKNEDDTAGEEGRPKDADTSTIEPQLHVENEITEEQEGSAADESDAKSNTTNSTSAASKQRSQSFRQGVAASTGASESKSPQLEVQELYRKQAVRIEELEAEAKAGTAQNLEYSSKLAKLEEELERLREGSSDLAEWKSKAAQAERVSAELASVQRQLTQLQQSSRSDKRRVSAADADLTEQLESKTATIESLEMELSNLRNQVKTLEASVTDHQSSVKDWEQRIDAAERAKDSSQEELEALKVSMTFPSDETTAANSDPEALAKRITLLESDLRTAHNNVEAAGQRASHLEQKVEALTKLHKEATTAAQTKDRELSNLRDQMKRRERVSHVRDASDFELGEDETETGALQARIRALEAENFDLRRGVWREKRTELQPGMADDGVMGSGEYEDVDLNGPYSPLGRRQQSGMQGQQSSSFQDVIASGISAFTGRPREPAKPAHNSPLHARKQSLGLLDDDDDGFDEEAFRLAQEEEAKNRIERVREIKRGLEGWRGWRLDIVELRQAGGPGVRDVGQVFEI